jgi:hypothetical protein
LVRPGAVIEECIADAVPNDLVIRAWILPCDPRHKVIEKQLSELIGGCAIAVAEPPVDRQ